MGLAVAVVTVLAGSALAFYVGFRLGIRRARQARAWTTKLLTLLEKEPPDAA